MLSSIVLGFESNHLLFRFATYLSLYLAAKMQVSAPLCRIVQKSWITCQRIPPRVIEMRRPILCSGKRLSPHLSHEPFLATSNTHKLNNGLVLIIGTVHIPI